MAGFVMVTSENFDFFPGDSKINNNSLYFPYLLRNNRGTFPEGSLNCPKGPGWEKQRQLEDLDACHSFPNAATLSTWRNVSVQHD